MSSRRKLGLVHLVCGLAAPLPVYYLLYLFMPESLLVRSPLDIFRAAPRFMSGEGALHVAATVARWMACLVSAVLLGVVLGTLARLSRRVWSVTRPAVDFVRSTPAVTYAAFCMMLVPVGLVIPVTAIVANGVIMIIYTALALDQGLAQEERILVARCMGSRGARLFVDAVLPGALPTILDGVQVIVSLSLVYTIMLEAVVGGSRFGIGVLIFELKSALRISEMYVLIYVSGVLGFVANFLFARIRSRLHPWVAEDVHG